MGRRPGSTSKNKQENQMTALSLKDQLQSENPSSKRNNVGTEETTELTNAASLGKEIVENVLSPRRSQRIHNATPPSQVRYIQAVIENKGSERGEEDQQCFGQKNNTPKGTEEKIDDLYLLIEEQQKTIEALMSKRADNSCPSQNRSQAEFRLQMKIDKYKSMHIDSLKKIKDLEEEKYDLTKKLECAHAKLEGYEKGQNTFSGALEKFKDVFVLSSLAKTTETALGLSLPYATVAGHAPPYKAPETKTPAAKRKKGEASTQAAKTTEMAHGLSIPHVTVAGHAPPNMAPETETSAAKRKKGEASTQAAKTTETAHGLSIPHVTVAGHAPETKTSAAKRKKGEASPQAVKGGMGNGK